jgi:hypothetical protein
VKPFNISEKDIEQLKEVGKLIAKAREIETYLESAVITQTFEEIIYFLMTGLTAVDTKFKFKRKKDAYNDYGLDYKGLCGVSSNYSGNEMYLAMGKAGRGYGFDNHLSEWIAGLKEAEKAGVIKQKIKFDRLLEVLTLYKASLKRKKTEWGGEELRFTFKNKLEDFQMPILPIKVKVFAEGDFIEQKITSISFKSTEITLYGHKDKWDFSFEVVDEDWFEGDADTFRIDKVLMIQDLYPQIKEGFIRLIEQGEADSKDKKAFETKLKTDYGDIFVCKEL